MGADDYLHLPDNEGMAMSETQKNRANWIIDKILIGVSATLVVMSYNSINSSIQEFSKDINDLKTTTRVLEYRVSQIEKQ